MSENDTAQRRGKPEVRQDRTRQLDRPEIHRDEEFERVPVSGHRKILSVLGKDRRYVYRWVLDRDENGGRIQRFRLGGYQNVSAEGLTIGQDMVFHSDDQGSIVRVPEGKSSDFLYLMRIKREFYDEDQKAKADEIAANEASIRQPIGRQGGEDYAQYGEVKIDDSTDESRRSPLNLSGT